ncbi:hypothetical protein Leryth_002233 [Lithospermum erythrorhizon]|uniref:Metalloprotease n=1 Tax=Lithospermum erythrorhizon TaxID=34254 RepID=A0AAV3S0Q1_LITER|nr:hypothetical protein Leryth_002233 [Lithospermum erythrorhizon]
MATTHTSISTISLTSKLHIPKNSFQVLFTLPHLNHKNQPLCHLINKASSFGFTDKIDVKSGVSCICFSSYNEKADGKDGWPILRRWDVPWNWQTIALSSAACGLSFVLTGLIEAVAIPYLGLQIGEFTLDEKAELLLLDQGITTVAVLAVLYGLTKSATLPDDIYRYDLRGPFDLQKGWLLWAGAGLGGAILAIAAAGATLSFFSGENPQRETDALMLLLPLIGSSSISTACLVGITGVLAPVLEETVFRGFLMVSITKWLPTPFAILISAAVFAAAHLTPGEFPQLFLLGIALGLSYAQTHNLLTPIIIHAIWNSGIILLLTFLQLQGYDIRELIQGS